MLYFLSYIQTEIFPSTRLTGIGKRKPLALKSVIKSKERYETVAYENLEGDDVLGLLATNGDTKTR